MDKIDALFERLDEWRHLPNYQLERRADIFFSLYLPEVLEEYLGYTVQPIMVPEFPVHIGTICPNKSTSKSYKIDCVALSGDGEKAILVEIKTDGLSRRVEQDNYLRAACEVGFNQLLDGLFHVFKATNYQRKYFMLFLQLEQMGLLYISKILKEFMKQTNHKRVNDLSHQML